MTPMTEEQIERRVEKMVDHLDRVYMAGGMTDEDYRKAMDELDQWAERQSRAARPFPL
jgi:tRNA C32,U32 (ribose-2'-O)-methylase TrmJ